MARTTFELDIRGADEVSNALDQITTSSTRSDSAVDELSKGIQQFEKDLVDATLAAESFSKSTKGATTQAGTFETQTRKATAETKGFRDSFESLNKKAADNLGIFGDVISRVGEIADIGRVLTGFVFVDAITEIVEYAKEIYSLTDAGKAAAAEQKGLEDAAKSLSKALEQQSKTLERLDYRRLLQAAEADQQVSQLTEVFDNLNKKIQEQQKLVEKLGRTRAETQSQLDALTARGDTSQEAARLSNELQRLGVEQQKLASLEGEATRVARELSAAFTEQAIEAQALATRQSALSESTARTVGVIQESLLLTGQSNLAEAMGLGRLASEAIQAEGDMQSLVTRVQQLGNQKAELDALIQSGEASVFAFAEYNQVVVDLTINQNLLTGAIERNANAQKALATATFNTTGVVEREITLAGRMVDLGKDSVKTTAARIDVQQALERQQLRTAGATEEFLKRVEAIQALEKTKQLQELAKQILRTKQDFDNFLATSAAALTEDPIDDLVVAYDAAIQGYKQSLQDGVISTEQYRQAIEIESLKLQKNIEEIKITQAEKEKEIERKKQEDLLAIGLKGREDYLSRLENSFKEEERLRNARSRLGAAESASSGDSQGFVGPDDFAAVNAGRDAKIQAATDAYDTEITLARERGESVEAIELEYQARLLEITQETMDERKALLEQGISQWEDISGKSFDVALGAAEAAFEVQNESLVAAVDQAKLSVTNAKTAKEEKKAKENLIKAEKALAKEREKQARIIAGIQATESFANSAFEIAKAAASYPNAFAIATHSLAAAGYVAAGIKYSAIAGGSQGSPSSSMGVSAAAGDTAKEIERDQRERDERRREQARLDVAGGTIVNNITFNGIATDETQISQSLNRASGYIYENNSRGAYRGPSENRR